jgi:hypothetical protein
MSSKGRAGRYAVGIGSGAAAGAAAGTSILPGWGSLIGGAVGAIGGAIGTGVNEGYLSDQDKRLKAQQDREKKAVLLDLLRNEAQQYGAPTGATDTALEMQGLNRDIAEQNRQVDLSRRLDPNAFVGMATNATRAAGGIYNAANQPSPGPNIPTLENPGAYQYLGQDQQFQLQGPRTDDEYALDPSRFGVNRGFR